MAYHDSRLIYSFHLCLLPLSLPSTDRNLTFFSRISLIIGTETKAYISFSFVLFFWNSQLSLHKLGETQTCLVLVAPGVPLDLYGQALQHPNLPFVNVISQCA